MTSELSKLRREVESKLEAIEVGVSRYLGECMCDLFHFTNLCYAFTNLFSSSYTSCELLKSYDYLVFDFTRFNMKSVPIYSWIIILCLVPAITKIDY